ncbi:MAG: SDR family oxidoreductase [Thermodesulfobacteriota bacterium]
MSGPVLVAGAAGLLGGMLLWRWRNLPQGLAALVRDPAVLAAGAWPGVRVVAGDVTDPASLTAALAATRPGLVVNCAAVTNVDLCERRPELALAVNAHGAASLARAAADAGAGFVQIGSDAVYAAGPGPHAEDAAGGTLSAYAQSKLKGDALVMAAHPAALVLRTCIFGPNQDPARLSLAEWVVNNLTADNSIPGFCDVRFSPLFTASLAPAILAGVGAGLSGVYNLGCAQGLSKYDFARRLAVGLGRDPALVRPASVAEVALTAPRPADPVLDSRRFAAAAGWPPPGIDQEIKAFLDFAAGGELAAFRRFGGWTCNSAS